MSASFDVHLYREPWAAALDCEALASYVERLLPSIRADVREPFVSWHLSRLPADERALRLGELARAFAGAKVRNPARPDLNAGPLAGEVDYERRRLEAGSKVLGLLYDGISLMNLLAALITAEERSRRHIHVVFTNQLFGTWQDDDRRYHARVSLYGFPSLISTTGLVEAPAKPREFYFLKQQYTALGMADAVDVGMKKEFWGRVLGHNDERTTEVLKGYALQALFYHIWGEPFCPDRGCRLYNAHWQEELLAAQLGGDYELCPRHEQMLKAEG